MAKGTPAPEEETAEMVDGGAIALKIGLGLVQRVAPSGLAWIRTWLKGKTIIVVGQPRAGKSSFVQYFQYGIFTDPSHKAPRTRRIKKTAAFTVGMGRDKALQLEVRTAVDTVGQVQAEVHAGNVARFRPHAVIIVLDLSADWRGRNEYSGSFYLGEFCDHLSERLHSNMEFKKRLKAIHVVLNKKDLVTSAKVSRWRRNVEKILDQQLKPGFGTRTKDIPILPCTLIGDGDMGRTADAVISKLAISLQ